MAAISSTYLPLKRRLSATLWRPVVACLSTWSCNDQIRANEVRLINAEGKQLGVFPLNQALTQAQQLGMNLVQLTKPVPGLQNDPLFIPVCKLTNSKKPLTELKDKKQKEKKTLMISASISDHDLSIKIAHARKLLTKGHPIKFYLKTAQSSFKRPAMASLSEQQVIYGKLLAALKDLIIPLSGDILTKAFIICNPKKS